MVADGFGWGGRFAQMGGRHGQKPSEAGRGVLVYLDPGWSVGVAAAGVVSHAWKRRVTGSEQACLPD